MKSQRVDIITCKGKNDHHLIAFSLLYFTLYSRCRELISFIRNFLLVNDTPFSLKPSSRILFYLLLLLAILLRFSESRDITYGEWVVSLIT